MQTVSVHHVLPPLRCTGDQISSKQLRDDLMTMLVAGHETTAAVLTWTFHLLEQHPDAAARVREEVRALERVEVGRRKDAAETGEGKEPHPDC